MKRIQFSVVVQFISYVLLCGSTVFAEAKAENISLQADAFEHIQFKKIKASRYTFHGQLLQIDVDESASFLMLPFATVKKIDRVSFEWRSDGQPRLENAEQEEQRQGDDSVFKLGLLLKANDSFINPLLPSWMKRVEALLKFPSENMINLVVASKHAPGEQWPNPYNKRVTTVAIDSVENEQGWMQAAYQFDQPVDVVGLWLMADGDNTHSKFTVYIRKISLE